MVVTTAKIWSWRVQQRPILITIPTPTCGSSFIEKLFVYHGKKFVYHGVVNVRRKKKKEEEGKELHFLITTAFNKNKIDDFSLHDNRVSELVWCRCAFYVWDYDVQRDELAVGESRRPSWPLNFAFSTYIIGTPFLFYLFEMLQDNSGLSLRTPPHSFLCGVSLCYHLLATMILSSHVISNFSSPSPRLYSLSSRNRAGAYTLLAAI